MSEPEKPFACRVADCGMTFTNEDHLNVHTKKHDMILQLGLGQKAATFVADQTPTPTRFIRNCEEVGLFQDLQNVNPFDETFKRAMDTKSCIALSLDGSISAISSDDALHTPNIFSQLSEDSPTIVFSHGATDLRTNLSINRSSSDESAVIVKSLTSQNEKTSQNDISTTSKLVETQSLQLDTGESSKVTIVRQNSLELAQSVLDTNIRKDGDVINNVEVKFHSNFEIRQTLQNSDLDNVVVGANKTNLVNVEKSVQIPLISINDSSTNQFDSDNQENMKSVVIKKDVMLTAMSKNELNVSNQIKKNFVELISQKSLDMAIDSLTSDCLKRIDSIEENKSHLQKIDKDSVSNNLISKMKNNLQTVLHNAIEKHAIEKTHNNVTKLNNQNSDRNSLRKLRKLKNIVRRANSGSSDEILKYKRQKRKINEPGSQYEITLKLPNGQKVRMKSVDTIREKCLKPPDDEDSSHFRDSESNTEYDNMLDTKQKLKDAINTRKLHKDNPRHSLLIARDKRALNNIYTNTTKNLFMANVETTNLPDKISSFTNTTEPVNENVQGTYVLPINVIDFTNTGTNLNKISTYIPPITEQYPPSKITLCTKKQSKLSNNFAENIFFINNKQNATKGDSNAQLSPHVITYTNTVLPSIKPAMTSLCTTVQSTYTNTINEPQNVTQLHSKTQWIPHSMTYSIAKESTSSNTTAGNLVIIDNRQNGTQLDARTQLLPHNMTYKNTVLPSNRSSTSLIVTTSQSTSTIAVPGNVLLINNTENVTKSDSNTQLFPQVMAYSNSILPSNIALTSLLGTKKQATTSTTVAGNIIVVNSTQKATKLDGNTTLLPHLMTYTNTALPSNKIAANSFVSTTQSMSSNTINISHNLTNLGSNTQLKPHPMTYTNTVLPSNKLATTSLVSTTQSTSSNTINISHNVTNLGSNTQLKSHLMTYTNTVLPSNKLATTSLVSTTSSNTINISPNLTNLGSNTQLKPHPMTYTNTVLPSNKLATTSLVSTTQSTSSNTINISHNLTNLGSNTQLKPHLMTYTNTVLPSHKLATTSLVSTTQSTSSNTINISHNTTKFHSNTQPLLMTYINPVLPSNKIATTSLVSTAQSTLSNTINILHNTTKLGSNAILKPIAMTYPNQVFSSNVLVTSSFVTTTQSTPSNTINISQNTTKLDSDTQLLPHIIMYTNPVLPSSNVNPKDDIAATINRQQKPIFRHEQCKVAIPLIKEERKGMKKQNAVTKTQTISNGVSQHISRHARQNAAVQRYRKRQSEHKKNITKKNEELRVQNDKLARELTMAYEEIARLRGLWEKHKNCNLHIDKVSKGEPIHLQPRYVLLKPEDMSGENFQIISSGNSSVQDNCEDVLLYRIK